MNTISDPVHLSNLKKIGEAPAIYKDSLGRDEDKLAYRHGRLTHLLLLGVQAGVKWDIFPGRRAGKVWEEFRDARPDVDIFTKKEYDLALAMAKSVEATPLAMKYLKGEFELPVEWTYEGTGRRCCTRGIDVLNREKAYTAELKTAVSSHPERFPRDAIKLGYHAQGSWFKDAAKSLGVTTTKHYVIAVEKKRPHVVTVFCITARAMLEGEKLVRGWMERLKSCEDANEFPPYAQDVVDLDVRSDDEENDDLVYEGDDEDEDGEASEDEEKVA